MKKFIIPPQGDSFYPPFDTASQRDLTEKIPPTYLALSTKVIKKMDWVGKRIEQFTYSGTVETQRFVGRKGTVRETFDDEKGETHLQTNDGIWCPAKYCRIIDDAQFFHVILTAEQKTLLLQIVTEHIEKAAAPAQTELSKAILAEILCSSTGE